MSESRGTADVVIIGGGIIGCTIARELATHGMSVVIVERDSPGRQATWAAGGMLSPLIESDADDPFFFLADRSFDLYPALIDAVRRESGIDVDYRTAGKLQCALTDEDEDELKRLAASRRADAYGLELLSGDDARADEPSLSSAVRAALFVQRDHVVDNRLLSQAVAAAASERGVEFVIGTPVERIAIDNGRATAVVLASGVVISADHVVVAAGAWSGETCGMTRAPVVPIRGQMLAVDTRAAQASAADAFAERVVGTSHCYMIPRSDGRLLIGATVEDVGFARGPTPAGLTWLIDSATAVVPGIADLPIIETWCGYRPGTPDAWPILGPDPDVEGLIYATGHFRNGILLAPVTAEVVSSVIRDRLPQWAAPFSITRFAD